MKIITLLAIFFLSFLQAGIFDKDVEFKYNKTDMQRKTPANKEYLLSYNNILEEVRTSVVNISTKKNIKLNRTYANPFFNDPFFNDFFRGFNNPRFSIPKEKVERALGSGVIVTSDGYIVTNTHVIDGADQIKVSIPDKKKEYDAKIIGTDPKTDLAVIKIDAKDLNAITFYDSDKAKLGDIVFALGNPFGVGETITQGMISATGRTSVGINEYENFIQTDAPINPGNSGGALINSAGSLIGINSAIISKSGGNVGIGFAIPSNMVERVSKILINDGKYTRAYLGVSISDITDDISNFYGTKDGALVTSVQENTPADKIGLKRGDLIISVDNKKIKSANQIRNTIGTYSPDSKIKIVFLRDKTKFTKEVKLGSNEDISYDNGYGVNYKGMKVEVLDEQLKKKLGISYNINGVYVSDVKEDSKSSKAGILRGDIIVQIENKEVSNIEEFKKATKSSGEKRIYLYRRGVITITVL
ncbi:MAG: peptidase S1 [Arcobacter sp.]|nr:MAG: peptidase S1 [Arcobacter sp.]